MNKKITQVGLLVSFLTLTSCGGKKSAAVDDFAFLKDFNSRESVIYPNIVCDEQKSNETYKTTFSVPLYNNGSLVSTSLSLSSFSVNTGLTQLPSTGPIKKVLTNGVFRTHLIYDLTEKTIYGRKSKNDYDNESDTFNLFPYTTAENPLALTICENELYPEESAQSIAISVLPFLQKAYDFTLLAIKSAPSQIILLVNSQFIEQREYTKGGKSKTVERHEVLNASWRPDILDKNYSSTTQYNRPGIINILPISNELDVSDFLKIKKLWQSPFVITHEYGHHILQPDSNSFALKSIQHQGLNCFKKEFKKRKNFVTKNIITPSKAMNIYEEIDANDINDLFIERIYGSISESFADLFAYYTLGEDYSDNSNTGCMMGSTRTVFLPYFTDGSQKFLDDHNAERFSYYSNQSEDICDVDLTSSHEFGAIFSYNINKIFNEATLSREARLNILYKINKRVENYLGKIESSFYEYKFYHDITDPKKFKFAPTALKIVFTEMLKDIAAFSNETEAKFNSTQCQTIKNQMPLVSMSDLNSLCQNSGL